MHASREVGDDSVDPELEQGVDLAGVVDRPDVDGDVVGVGVGDQLGGHEGGALEVGGNLERHHALGHGAAPEGAADRGDDLAEARAEGRAHRVFREGGAQRDHDLVLARGEQGPIGAIEALDQIEGRADGRVVEAFDLEVEAGVGEGGEGLFEGGDPDRLAAIGMGAVLALETVSGVEGLERRPV